MPDHGLTLALLEQAPDRQTAQILLTAALHQGVSTERMRASWSRWEENYRQARLRGDTL